MNWYNICSFPLGCWYVTRARTFAHSLRIRDERLSGSYALLAYYYYYYYFYREWRGAMVRAWGFANIAACRAVWNPAWCRIFQKKIVFLILSMYYYYYYYYYQYYYYLYREGRGAMVRAWGFANVAACRAVSNPAWCKIFIKISCFSSFDIGTLFRCCALGLGTLPSHASLDSCVNEYLVGQRWQCVR